MIRTLLALSLLAAVVSIPAGSAHYEDTYTCDVLVGLSCYYCPETSSSPGHLHCDRRVTCTGVVFGICVLQ